MESNISSNETTNLDANVGYYLPTLYAMDVLLLLSNLIAITANITVIFVILKYRLHSPTNTFILNWSVLDILHLLTSPGIYKWYSYVHERDGFRGLEIRYGAFFVSFEISIVLLLMVLMFKDYIKSFNERYIYIIGFVWVITVFVFTIPELIYLELDFGRIVIPLFVFFGLQVLLAVVVVTKYVIKCVKKTTFDEDQKLRMYMVTSFTYVWWQLFVIMPMAPVRSFLIPSFYCVVELNAVANLFVLTALDKYFEMSLYRLCKITTEDYDAEINFINDGHVVDTVP